MVSVEVAGGRYLVSKIYGCSSVHKSPVNCILLVEDYL